MNNIQSNGITNTNLNYSNIKSTPNFKSAKPVVKDDSVQNNMLEFRRTIDALKSDLSALELKKLFCTCSGDKEGAEKCAKMIAKIKEEISDYL